jgi:hypothetical protein
MEAAAPTRLARRVADRWREGGRGAAVRVVRLTGAAVEAYVAAKALLPSEQPLTGPLTALLVVQVSPFSTLTAGLRRVAAVVSGVLLAVLFSALFALDWWSLGLVLAAALTIGQLLRLRDHLLEVPISAMLVLGVASSESAALDRAAETLVGAGVGILVNLLFAPALTTPSAAAAVERVAERAAELLERAAGELTEDVSADRAAGWLEDCRRLGREVRRADRALEEAGESRRLNPRSVGTPDRHPVLANGLTALEHTVVSLRSLFTSLLEGIREVEGFREVHDAELRGAFVVLLQDLAAAVRSYGRLVRSDAEAVVTTDPAPDRVPESPTEQAAAAALPHTLTAVHEARARLSELMLVDARDEPGLWELRGSLLAEVARVLRELDAEEHDRQLQRWRSQAARPPRTAVGRLGTTSLDLARHPVRRRRPRR